MECFGIREATLEDKQAVLDINDNVYGGRDYLKALYEDEFINSSNTTSYVGVVNGKIQNKMTFLRSHTHPHILAILPHFQKLLRFALKLSDTRLQTSSISCPNNIYPLTEALLEKYFKTEEYRNYLFPDERMIIDYVPFRILPSNIPLFWKRNDHCHRVTDLRNEDGDIRGLMSIITTLEGTSGVLVCFLDIFGTDIRSVKLHLMSHFEFLSKRNNADIALLVATDICLECSGHVETLCEELGLITLLKSIEEPSNITEILLFERTLSGVE